MAERIASGDIYIGLRDEEAIAGLKRIDREFDKTMDKIDRTEATASVDADLTPLERAIKQAKQKLDGFDKEKAEATLDADSSQLDKEIKRAKGALKEFERVAQAKARVDLESAVFTDKLNQAKRRLKVLNGQKVKVSADADTKALEAKIEKAIAEITELDGKKAKVELEAAGYDKLIATLAAADAAADKTHKADLKRQAAAAKASEDRIETIRKREEELEKARVSAAAREQGRLNSESRFRGRMQAQRDREYGQAVTQAYGMERMRVKEASDEERAAAQRAKELSDVPKLERAYVMLSDRVLRLAEAKRKAQKFGKDSRAVLLVEVEEREARAKIASLARDLRRITGKEPIKIPGEPEVGRDMGERFRTAILSGGSLSAGFATMGREGADNFSRGFTSRYRQLRTDGPSQTIRRSLDSIGDIGKGAGAAGLNGLVGVLTRFGNSAAGATVRLGPFTTTIKGAVKALAVMGPALLSVVGAASALVGSVGSAALGLGALASGALLGGIPAFLGFGLVIKGVAGDMRKVTKAQKAYDDALLKGNSELASKKLKELRATMGNVSKETVANIKTFRELGSAFREGTTAGRGTVFKAIGEGAKTAQSLMGIFTRRTNEGLVEVEKSTTRWGKSLRSAVGQDIMGKLMGNFNGGISNVLDGLGNIVAYLAKVGVIASDTGITGSFKGWSADLLAGASNADVLKKKVQGVLDSAKAVGKFFQSGGRLIAAFFGAGVKSGNSLLDTMTKAMNRWTDMIKLDSNGSFKDFFSDSVAGAQALYSAFAPLISSFVRWAALMAPFVTGLLRGASAVLEFGAGLLKLVGLTSSIGALATTLGALWAIGKIGAATSAIARFTAALFGLSSAQRGVAASSAAQAAAAGRAAAGARVAAGAAVGASTAARGGRSGLGPLGATAAVAAAAAVGRYGGAADDAAKKTGKLARAGTMGGNAIRNLGGMVLGTTGLAGGLAVAATGAAVGLYLLATRTKDYEKASQAANAAGNSGAALVAALPGLNMDYAQSALDVTSAQLSLKDATKQAAKERSAMTKLEDAGKKGSKEYAALENQHAQSVLNLRQAKLNETVTTERRIKLAQQEGRVARKAIQDTTEAFRKRREEEKGKGDTSTIGNDGYRGKVADVYARVSKEAKAAGQSIREYVNENKKVTGSLDIDKLESYGSSVAKTKTAWKELQTAQDSAFLSNLNVERGIRKLPPLAEQAAAAFGKLNRAGKGGAAIAKKIAVTYSDSGSAGRVAASAARSLRAGVPKKLITNVVANSSGNAAADIKRLQNLRLGTKTLTILTKGGAEARQTLSDLLGRKLTTKEMRIISKGGPLVLEKLDELNNKRLKALTQKLRADPSDANAKAALVNATKLKTLIQGMDRVLSNPGYAGPTPPTVTQTVLRIIRQSKGYVDKRNGADGGMFASGRGEPTNISGAVPDARKQERAAKRAALDGNPRKAISQKITKPTYLTGEEATPEFVVSTNPKYRERNQRFAAQAAEAVGLKVQKAGEVIRAAAGFSGSAFNASTAKPSAKRLPPLKNTGSLARSKKFNTPKKRVKKALTIRRAYAGYVEGLQTRQSDLEREVSIRESSVREPAEMVIESGTRKITDPVTNEVTEVPNFVPNPKIESEYKPDLDKVRVAMQALIQIVMELVRSIPLAISANRAERGVRTDAIGILNREIKKEENRKITDKGGAKGKSEKKIAGLKEQRDGNLEINKGLRADETELGASRKEAGFDYREFTIAKDKVDSEYNGASGGAAAEAGKQNDAQNASTGNTGEPPPKPPLPEEPPKNTLSTAQQESAAGNEKASVLQQFGGNMGPSSGGGLRDGGAVSGTGGSQANPASSGFNGGGVAADLTASSNAARSSGGAASAMSGSGQPSGTMGGGGSSVVNNTQNITIPTEYKEAPEDPHAYSAGVKFMIESTF